jgi:acetylornithine deacetylase
MSDWNASILQASATIEQQSLELLSALIVAAEEGSSVIDRRTGHAMDGAGCAVEVFDYAPHEVPMVDEFASTKVASTARERCLIGRMAGAGGGRSLLLFAHPDTEDHPAQPAWQSDPFTPTIRRGRLHGWGVADDLAGIAMLVRGVEVLRRAGLRPKGDVTLVGAPSKKHRRGISAALHHGLEADAAIYLHPAESGRGLDEIKAFAPGQLEFAITIQGMPPDTSEPAHTAFAHRAINPFDKGMVVVDALRALDAERAREVRHPRLERAIGRSTNLMLTCCDFGSADRLSRIAPVCRLGGAMTLVPGEKLEDVMGQVEHVVRTASETDPWLTDHPPMIEWLAGVSSAETAEDSDLYSTVADVLTRCGAHPRVNPLHTSSDIRNPIVQRGIPTVGVGPRCGGLAMSGLADEWVDIADYLRAIVATARIIAAWCGTEPA